jgi:hypothetical protein
MVQAAISLSAPGQIQLNLAAAAAAAAPAVAAAAAPLAASSASHLRYLSAFVVSPDQCDAVRVAHLQGQQHQNRAAQML